jgi:hypothetical protein
MDRGRIRLSVTGDLFERSTASSRCVLVHFYILGSKLPQKLSQLRNKEAQAVPHCCRTINGRTPAIYTFQSLLELGLRHYLESVKAKNLPIVRVIADILHLVPSRPTFAHEVNVKINFVQALNWLLCSIADCDLVISVISNNCRPTNRRRLVRRSWT